MSKERIIWKFSLSRGPWWLRQYEPLIGITKQSVYKSNGKSLLTWSEIEDVLLDVKVNLNNLPLTYTEEDLKCSVLTLNFKILGRDIKLPDDSPEEKRWKRWVHEYFAVFRAGERESHNLNHKEKTVKLNISDVFMIKENKKNQRKWKIAIIDSIFMGKDNTIRSIRIRTRKNVNGIPSLHKKWIFHYGFLQ